MPQDLLGENPNASVNAKTDMSWNDDDEKAFQAKFNPAPSKDYDVTIGDTVKAVGTGALGMVAGMGELSDQLTGYGGGLRDLAQSGSDALIESMTDDGRAALNAELVSEDSNGKLGIGNGAADVDVWAMKFAQGIGSLAGGMLPGGAAGGVTRMVASSMLKRGASMAVAEATAAKTAQLLGEAATTGTFIAGSHGSAMLDGRQQVMDMDSGWLADNSEHFQESLRRLSADPKNADLRPSELVNLAKEETADFVSKTIAGDPATIAASVAGAYGDRLLFGAVKGQAVSKGILKGAGKGAATEALTEAVENAGQTYGQNVSINDVAGTDRDPWQGAAKNAIEGAAIGALTGSVPGAVGGFRGKRTSENDESSIATPEQDELAQAQSSQAEEVQAEQPFVGDQQQEVEMPASDPIPQQTDIQASRQNLRDKGVLSERNDTTAMIQLARAYDPERAQQIESELSDPAIDENPEYVSQLETEYAQLAERAQSLDTDPLATNIDNRVRENKRKNVERNEALKAEQQPKEAEGEQVDAPKTLEGALTSGTDEKEAELAAIRDRVKANLLPEDQGNDELIDRLAQVEFDYKYNDAPFERNKKIEPEPYQDKGPEFSRDRAQDAINAKAEQAHEAELQRQAETERNARGEQPEANPNWQGEIDGKPVTRTYMRDKANQALQAERDKLALQEQNAEQSNSIKQAIRDRLGNDTEGRFNQFSEEASRVSEGKPTQARINELKAESKQRGLERAFGGNTIASGMSKRLRRKLQRSKGFDSEAVLNEFRNNEKRLQAYQEEARRQAEREANDPENIARRKSAQALFEDKINSPEAQAFRENLISESVKRVNQTLDSSAGTVLEMDGQKTSLPKVKSQLATNIKNLAHKFIGKTAIINESIKGERAANEDEKALDTSDRKVLYSRESITRDKPAKGLTLKQAELAADQWMTDYKGGAGVKIKVVQTQVEAEKIVGMNFDDGMIVHALYNDPTGQTVIVADNIANAKHLRQKLRHEVLVHHGLKAVVGESEYRHILERIFKSKDSPYLKDIWDKINKSYSQFGPVDRVEEVLAHAAESERPRVKQWLDRIIEMVATALRKVGLMKPTDMTKAELYNIIATLEDRTKRVGYWSDMSKNPNPNENTKLSQAKLSQEKGIRFSQSPQMTLDEALAQDSPAERFSGVLNSLSGAVKKAVQSKAGSAIRGDIGLGAVTLRQLADLAKNKLPQLSEYVDTVHRMLTRRNQLAFDAHDMADGIRKWMAKDKKAAEEMFDIAHQATVEGVDPEKDFASAEEAILNRFEHILPTKSKRDVNETIQDRIRHLEKVNEGSHKTNEQMKELKELKAILKDEPRRRAKHARLRIRFNQMPEEAKQHYRAMRDKYKERHQLYRTLLEQQIANSALDGKMKKMRIADLKSQFELQEVMAPYFPLTRFGDYWISTVDESGEKRFMMYESEKAQQAAKKKLESNGFEVFSGYKLENNPGIEGASLGFITDLMTKLDEAKLNEVKKAELKDTVYQMYLQALPSRSMRKQFMHRQKVKGWSNDALRALAENMMKGSYQLARLEYADQLTKLASETAKTAGSSGDNQSSRYANELMKRHEWVMNPKHSAVAQKITSLGFLYMLGFSPAAAAVNTTQNFVVALPMIGSKFGFASASKELAKATKDFIAAKGTIKDKLKDLDELAAFSQWYDSGLLDATNAHDLAGMAEGQNWKYNPAYEKFSGWMSALFHKAEVYNRETTALAAYRLARKNGMGHEEATKYAEKLTWEAHYDYTNVNRARYMQSPMMKVATQFKQYSQNMTYYLARNAYQSMKGMTKEERSEARKQLVGTLGMTALIGGVSALPVGMIFGMLNGINAMFGDDDEPWDAETEFKTFLSEVLGSDVADKLIYGVGGAGVSPRISLDGMWIRDPNRDMEGEDTWSFYAQQAAGPVLGGILLQAIKSGDRMLDGEYYRGVEGILPKVFKDAMKAYRYADEGALNSRGDAYREADDFSFLELGLQSMGLTPAELSKQYQVNNARKEYEQHVLDRRSSLMKAYFLAWKQKDTQMMVETQRKITQFNRKYPKLALTSKKIRQSIKMKIRYSNRSSSGINLNKHFKGFADRIVW